MALAVRQARRYGSRLWWAVALLAFVLRVSEQRGVRTRTYRVRDGQGLDIDLATKAAA